MAEGAAAAFQWSPWALPYFAAAAACGGLTALVVVRGRGNVRRAFIGLLLSVGATLIGTGLVFCAGNADACLGAARFSQSVAVWTAPCAVEFARAITGRPLVRLRLLAWAAAALVSALALTPWVIAG